MVPKVVGSNPIFHPNKRSKKMSQDIFLFFTPTRKLAYGRRCKEQNVLRSSFLRSAVWKRPRGERMGKTSKAKSIPSSTQHLRVSSLTSVGVKNKMCYAVASCECSLEAPPRRADGKDEQSEVNPIFHPTPTRKPACGRRCKPRNGARLKLCCYNVIKIW